MSEPQNFWRQCSACKKPIAFESKHYLCSVSTCNGLRTGYVFCSVSCFERHLPGARHRDAGAIESVAPKAKAAGVSTAAAVSASASTRLSSAKLSNANQKLPREVLIIASRLKEYIQAKSEYNTSASVMEVLSDQVRVLCDRAIDNAKAEGRKTVLDRDFYFLNDFLKR